MCVCVCVKLISKYENLDSRSGSQDGSYGYSLISLEVQKGLPFRSRHLGPGSVTKP